MEEFNNRFLDILKILLESKNSCTLQELSSKLNVSSKTISRTLKLYQDNNKLLNKYGFEIESKQGTGYTLNINENKKFSLFENTYQLKSTKVKKDFDGFNREKEIIKILLVQKDFITIQEIADMLYISEKSISTDLKSVRHLLQKVGIEVTNKPSRGIKIEGSEMSIRLCYSKYIFDNQSSDVTYHDIEYKVDDFNFVEKTLKNEFSKSKINLSDINRKHLITHIIVSLYRINKGFIVTFNKKEKEEIRKTNHYYIARNIVNAMKERFVINDIEEEIIYIAIQLLGKQTVHDKKGEYYLTKDIEKLLYEIFYDIKIKFDIDLILDMEIFSYLAMHFEPMLSRLKYSIKSNNPLVEDIKRLHPMSFDMGLIAKKVIARYYHYNLDDDEVSYLAMYFSLALDKLKYLQKPKNILVICGVGIWGSRILVYKLRQKYEKYINDIITCNFHELKNIPANTFDCIISTINEPIATNQPVIYIDDFLQDLKYKELDDFFLKSQFKKFNINNYLIQEHFFVVNNLENQESAIDYIINRIPEEPAVKAELKRNILEREKLSSTAFGNYCAIPHPVKMCTENTIFSIIVLKRNMIWGKKKVKYVFLLSPSKKNPSDLRGFNETLANFIGDSEKFSKFVNNPTFEELRSIFESMNS